MPKNLRPGSFPGGRSLALSWTHLSRDRGELGIMPTLLDSVPDVPGANQFALGAHALSVSQWTTLNRFATNRAAAAWDSRTVASVWPRKFAPRPSARLLDLFSG